MGLGMPIPDLSNKPGPGRPGWGPAGSYDFQFEVTGAVTIEAFPNTAGQSFTIKWQDGSTTQTSGSSTINGPAGAGIISINNEDDNTYADEFKIVSGQANVTKVISWGQNPWSIVEEAFKDCINLTDISTTSFIAGTARRSNQPSGCIMGKMFLGCTSLLEVDIRTWDLLTNGASWRLGGPFANLANLQKLDATGLKIKFFDANNVSTFNFANIGTSVADGCEFKMAGLDLSTSSTGYLDSLFNGTKFKAGSNLSNWKFPVNFSPSGWRGYGWFSNCILNDGILDISGWTTWPGNMLPSFNSFNSALTSQGTGKVDLSNFGLTNVFDFNGKFSSCELKEVIGFSTWGACAGNADMFGMFNAATLMRIDPSDNFSDTFVASLNPTNLKNAFNAFGSLLLDSQRGVAMNFNNIDLSNGPSFDSTWRNAKLLDAPDFSTAIFDNNNPVSFPTTFRSFNTLNSDSSLVLNSGKVTSFSSTFYAATINTVNINNGVDLSALTSVSAMFYYANVSTATLPSDANYSSLTSFGNWNTAFGGFSVCQGDILMRRLKATNLNANITANLPKITESPALVNSDRDFLENTRSWNITTATPDATLPFAYASYAVDPTGTTTISPTTTPPAGSVFTATNGLNISESGVITIGSFRGGSTIRCTYPDGCYNEVVMLIQVPFTMRTTIPANGSNFTLSPQMSDGECFIDWGDASSEVLTGSTTHSYAVSGSDQEYDIKLFDSPSGSKFTGFAAPLGVLEASYEKTILKWGEIEWQNNSWFGTTTTSVYKIRLAAPNGADHKPNLSQVTSLYKMFGTTQTYKTDKLTGWFEDTNDNLEHWDVSTITNMSYMFRNPDPVSTKDDGSDNILKCANWDVSNVQNFNYFMGGHRTSSQTSRNFSVQLNIEMTNWNTSGATDMSYMFWQHEKNKTGIENFRTENVTTLSFFYGGGTWNAKTKMYNSILRWDVSNVEDFSSASIVVGTNEADTNANFPNNWRFSTDASKNLNFYNFCGGDYMRLGAGPYYLTDLQAFATKTINETFYGGTSYTAWNMDNASSISNFGGSTYRGTPPLGLFRNYNIADWNITSKCTSFYNLWVSSRAAGGSLVPFDQDLSNWNVTGITGNQGYFMRGGTESNYQPVLDVNMSTSNYDATLIGWGAQAANVSSGVTVNFGTSKYSPGNTFEGSQGTNTYQGNSIYGGGVDMTIVTSIGDVVERPVDPNGVFDTYAIVTGYTGGGNIRATTTGNIGPSSYTVMDSDAAKGRIALINAGWDITDGGAYLPFTPVSMTIDVNAGDTFTIQCQSSSGNNFSVDWGDGNGYSSTPYTGSSATSPAYASGGEKTILITKDSTERIHSLYYRVNTNLAKIKTINNWGSNPWKSLYEAFAVYNSYVTHPNFSINTTSVPNLGNSPSLSRMFRSNTVTDFTNSNIENWNVDAITNFDYIFQSCTNFNVDVSNWNISNATNTASMFSGCVNFNQDISNWNTSKISNISGMLAGCTSFNYDINTKDTGSRLAWDVSNVTNFSSVFYGLSSYTYSVNKWQIRTDTGINMQSMFGGSTPDLDVSPQTVTVGSGAYQKTYLAWDTQAVTSMSNLFAFATSTTVGNNSDVSKWDTSSVTNLYRAFRYAHLFNRDISTHQVTVGTGSTQRTYNAWDVSSVTNMDRLFERANAFNQNIGNWNIGLITNGSINHVFQYTGQTTANYTDSLVGWANFVKNQTPDSPLNINLYYQYGRTYDENRSGGSNFANAFEARKFLTDTIASGGAGWTISSDTIIPLVIEPTKLKIRVAANSTLDFKFGDVKTGSSFQVIWGDGSTDSTGLGTGIHSHTYSNTTGSSIDYELEYNGGTTTDPCTWVRFDDNGDAASRNAIVEVSQWGSTQFTSLHNMFRNLVNNDVTATDTPDLSNATSLSGMFQSNGSLVNSNGSIGDWDISNINNITFLFNGANSFNVDISKWDTSSCNNFYYLFNNAASFNQDISTKYVTANDSPTGSAYWAWNTSAVGNIQNAFSSTSSFAPASGSNPGIYNWNTSSITNMKFAFTSSSYSKPLNTTLIQAGSSPTGSSYVAWDVSNVTNFESMFNSSTFNSDISKWKLKSASGKIVQLKEMFRNNTTFNQDISTKTIAAADSPYGTQYEAWNIESSNRISEVIRNSGVNQSLNWGVNTSWGTSDVHRWAAQQGGVLSTNNYTDQIVKWANEVNNNSKSPANMYAVLGDQGGPTPDFDTTRTYSSGFANAGRARSYLSLDVRVSGATGYNGTYYYNYETERYVNENDSTYEFRFDSEEGWQLFNEEGAQYTGGGTESSGPTSGTWTGVTVIDYSAGWTFDGALII